MFFAATHPDYDTELWALPLASLLPTPVPIDPTPADGAAAVPVDVELWWEVSDPSVAVTFHVFLDAEGSSPYELICEGISQSVCAPPAPLASGTAYWWQVLVVNERGGTVAGPLWRFTTEPEEPPPPVCPPGSLCLRDGRFPVEVEFETFAGQRGQGVGVGVTDETGFFWFFAAPNVEVFVKVLDACGEPFESYWVFAGGLTDLGITLTVTDTWDGTLRTYENPLGTPFQTITATAAFATCP